jgi:hypothetical protein
VEELKEFMTLIAHNLLVWDDVQSIVILVHVFLCSLSCKKHDKKMVAKDVQILLFVCVVVNCYWLSRALTTQN